MSWTVYSKNGNTARCVIHELEYSGTFMGECFLTCTINSEVPIDFQIGDYIMYRGERFEINYDPTSIKNARKNTSGSAFVYDSVKFNSLSDELIRCDFLDYVKDDNLTHYSSLPTFSFYAESINALAERIQVNLDRIYTGDKKWTVTVHPEYVNETNKSISINNINVWDALALVNSEFKANFIIRGRTITIGTAGIVVGNMFGYGKGKGLYSIQRTADSSQAIVTRLRAYGGTTNMPYNYYTTYVNPIVEAPIEDVSYGYDATTQAISGAVVTLPFYMEFLSDTALYDVTINGHSYKMRRGNYLGKCYVLMSNESDKDNVRVGAKMRIENGIETDNVPRKYKKPSGALVPNNMAVKNLMLPDFPVKTLDPYIDSKNISSIGIREGSVFFDGRDKSLPEIHPSMEGMTAQQLIDAGISVNATGALDEIAADSVNKNNTAIADDGYFEEGEIIPPFKIYLKDIGFDINDYLTGETATISMKSGMCGGREFEILGDADKPVKQGDMWVLTCNRTYDEGLNLYFPYKDFNINTGDKFVLLGIDMPDVYIKAASQRLLTTAQKYLAKNDYVRYTYEPKVDEIFMANHPELHDRMKEGDLMLFKDEDLNINGSIIIDQLIIKHGESIIPKYTVILKEEKSVGTIEKIQNQIDSIVSGGQGSGGYNASQIEGLIRNYGIKYFISKLNNDIAEGHITFNQGVYVKGGTAGDGQSILEGGNSVIEEGNGIIEESLQVPIPATFTLGGLDNVDDIVDIPSNKDVILVKKAGSTGWTQEDKAISETIPEAPKDGKQYARQDGSWSEVKAASVDVPTKLSQLENDADYVRDPNYIHTDNNFSDSLKDQLSDLNTEYLNAANKLNYQRAKTFFSKTHADTNNIWGFVRYFNNLPTLTSTQVRITGVRSDFNGDQISDSYVNLPGATQTLAGIMTAADKTKLDGIATGATRVIVDSVMSETSLNPVQNKVITSKFIQIEGRTTSLETQYSTLSNTLSPIKAAWDKRGTKDGFLLLGNNNLIPSQYLPSYVDDVVDVYATYDKSATGVLSNIKLYTNAAHTTAVVPETGKIYIDITSGKPPYQFRWSGTTYIDLNTGGLVLGTIAGTAFEGDKGNILYTNFGEGDNLLYTQKARDFFKSLAVGVSFISNLEVGSVSETSANLVYDSNVFGATTNRITFALPVADSKKAGIISAYDKIFIDDIKSKVDKFVTLDTGQTITGVKKITSYLSLVSGTRKINISGDEIKMYSYASGGSAQAIKFCDSDGNLLSSLGYMVNNNTLDSVYLGTGYDDSNHWVTFRPTKTVFRRPIILSSGSDGTGGILDMNNNGLVMYSGNYNYISRGVGTTYIRSGNENLYHTKGNNNYIILDQSNTLISVDATPNSLVKRTSTGFINCNLAGVTFYDTAYSTNPQNGWVITTATNYGKTSKDLKIKQYVGTGGNLFLNDYRVATAKDKYVMSKYTIDASTLNEDTYYPVTIKLSSGHNYRIEVLVQLDSGTKPSWSTHNSGFSVRFIEEIQGAEWGTIATRRRILDYYDSFCQAYKHPIGRVTQMTNSSTEVIYVRGGGKYFFFTSGSSFATYEPIIRTSTYTISEQSVSPTPEADLVFNVVRNMIMSDDVAIEPVANKIAKRDASGYLRAVRYYTTTPVENYAISHIAFFYNSDGYIRKTTLGDLNRQLRFDKLLNIITGSNEFNMLPKTYSNSSLFINHRSYTYENTYENTTSLIENVYIGNGQTGTAYVNARGYKKTGSTDRYALTGAGGHKLISYSDTAESIVERNGAGYIFAKAYAFNGNDTVYGAGGIELYAVTPHIDFHYDKSSDDFTSRIIEDAKNHMYIYASAGLQTNGFMTSAGFKKSGSDESHVLTGGGGHKLISDFVDRTSDQNISGIKNFFTTKVDGNYATRAIILRETNMGRDANKSNLYAPSIGFHWGNVNQSIISIHTDGDFHFTYTTTEGDYRSIYCNGIKKANSDSSHALTGDGGHQVMYIEPNASSLVKRTSEGHIKTKDILADYYMLHNASDNPYLKFNAAGNNYFIQAAASGIWMGPSATDKSLIINSTGQAGLGILPNSSYKLYVNGTIRSSGTINAGEAVDLNYGYINVSRPKTVENASCFSWVKSTVKAFALGFNSSNQIVLGSGKTDKTLTPWLTIGNADSTSRFQSHLETQTVSTEDGRFNHDLASNTFNSAEVRGTICINLPNGWVNSMNIYEIYVYEYNYNISGCRILVSGYNYSGNSSWVNYKYTSEGNYNRGVRLGYKDGKCCILLGETTSVWAYPQVYLANVYNGYSGLGAWKRGYTIEVLTSESAVTKIVTAQRSYSHAAGFMKDGSSDSYVLLGAGGHLAYAEGAISNSLVKRTGNGYIFGKFFHSDNPVQDTLTVTNLFFEAGSDGYHRKASLGHVTDTMRVATQTLKGLMSADDKKKVDLFDPSKYIRRDIDDDALGHLTFHAGIYVDGGVYSGQSILEANGVNGIMEANGNNIIEYSEPAPIATSMTLGELTNVSSSVNTAASSKVMFVKGAGETLWTQEVITPNILKGFADTITVATTPNDYNSKFTVVGIKQNSKIGSPNSETYSYLIGYRGWSDSSGGKSHEIGFNNQGIYHRIGSTTTWESWEKILTSANWSSFITIPTMPDLTPYAKKDFSNVTTQSLGQNGYCKFPNGLLIQWGKNTTTITIRIVNLPTPFLDENYIVTANISSTSATKEVSDIRIGTKTTGSFAARIPTQPSESTSSDNFEWIAIGRWK